MLIHKVLQTRFRRLGRTVVGTLAFVSCLTVLVDSRPAAAGADEPKPSDALKEEARKVLGRGNDGSSKDGSGKDASEKDAARASAWCIAIMSLRGDDRQQAGPLALEQVRTKGRLPEAFVEERTGATVIAYGRYEGPDDPKAQEDLKRVRAIEVDGSTPYAFAFLCPPETRDRMGSNPEYNLTRARAQYGDRAVQSLQVAVYGREDLKTPGEKELAEVRQKAEEYCLQLRREGELAFYFHGPRRSMVTIGVFDTTDYDPQLPSYNSARLSELRKRHPYNLYNGAAIREKRPGQKEGRLQPSTLVKIPDDEKAEGGPHGSNPPTQDTPKLAPPR